MRGLWSSWLETFLSSDMGTLYDLDSLRNVALEVSRAQV